MTKQELIDRMALEAGISRAAAQKAMLAYIEGIQQTLVEDQRYGIKGFGSWSVTTRQAYMGRHPQTGKPLHIPSKKVIKFKPSSKLLEQLNL